LAILAGTLGEAPLTPIRMLPVSGGVVTSTLSSTRSGSRRSSAATLAVLAGEASETA
jgi:hypothetical protein